MSMQLISTVIYTGEPVYRTNIPDAQRAVEEECRTKGGFVAPAHLLLENWPYTEWLTANSEDLSGVVAADVPRLGVKKDDCVVATYHGGNDGKWGLLPPDKVARALELREQKKGGLNDLYAAIFSDLYKGDVFTPLVTEGGMPDGRSVQVFSYEQLLAGEAQAHNADCTPYVVVRPLALARKTIAGYETIDRLTDREGKVTDSQVITYAGSKANAQGVIQRAKDIFKTEKLGVWHPFNNKQFNPEQHQGRLLCLGDSNSGLRGDGNLLNRGRFVRVEAEPRERGLVHASATRENVGSVG
ncbi:hypothetical protein HY772_04095 [Candidatus Woesearchaeota archaeon]|nr:hypothetical protein [Candidatus Woesearchaeota archaeon]